MSKPALTVNILALLLGCLAVYIGSYVHQQRINPMTAFNGTWSGRAALVTTTNKISYDVVIWVQGNSIIFTNTAQIDNDKKFAFSLDLEYVEHQQNKILFAVKDRNSVWLDELRQQGGVDIPMIGHLVQITLFRITENEIYMTFTLQNDYNFTTLLQRRA